MKMNTIDEKNMEKIEFELNNAVQISIKNALKEALFFKNESEIHGYLRCELIHYFKSNELLKDKTDLIIHECNTRLIYHRKSGIDNGIAFKSKEYSNLISLGHKPVSAIFDFAIWNPNRQYFEEGRTPIPKSLIGIEIKRQTETDKNNKPASKKTFIENIMLDCKKLMDAENELKYKYLIIILYYPNVFTLDVKNDLVDDLGDIKVVYCVIDKKNKKTIHQELIPNEW